VWVKNDGWAVGKSSSLRGFEFQIVACDGIAAVCVMFPPGSGHLSLFVIDPYELDHALKPLIPVGNKLPEVEQHLVVRR
jgi:hypothetical protein